MHVVKGWSNTNERNTVLQICVVCCTADVKEYQRSQQQVKLLCGQCVLQCYVSSVVVVTKTAMAA
jgi:hypothetical protein